MTPPPLPPELLAADGPLVAHIRATWPHTLAVYAFGSQIQGTAGPESDLDIRRRMQMEEILREGSTYGR